MTKFKFRLEAALRLRRLRVDAEKTRLQELVATHKRLENSLASLREERSAASAFVQGAPDTAAHDLRALSLFMLGLQSRANVLGEEISKLVHQIEQQKQQLLSAERDERVLSKLHDKRLAEWKLATQREIELTAQELWLFTHTTSKYASSNESNNE
jgi:flagellar export protein FliJ